ncbi:MAG: helix-turn-helix transcriptional regulator [Pseudomonadota bacterium]
MTDTVTIPRVEYEALLDAREELDDIAEAAAIRDRIRRGDEETVPGDVVDRLLSNESLLKFWREHRGLTQTDLAKASGVHRVSINKIEAGTKSPTVETLRKLADALRVDLDDLV